MGTNFDDNIDSFIQNYIEKEYSNTVLKMFEAFYKKIIVPDLEPVKKFLTAKFQITSFEFLSKSGKIDGLELVAPLTRAIQTNQKELRLGALYLLGRVADKRSHELLLDYIEDPDPDIRAQIIYSLGEIKEKSDIDIVIRFLNDPYEKVKIEAIWAIGEIGDVKAVEFLVPLMKDRELIEEIITTFGKLKDARIVPILKDFLEHKDDLIRAKAAHALGKIRDPKAVLPLIKLLNDSSSDAGNMAAYSLGEIGSPKAVEPLIEALRAGRLDEDVVMKSLAKIGKSSLNIIIDALGDEDLYIKTCAAKLLGTIGDAQAVDSLIIAMKNSDVFVLDEIINSLGKIGDKRSVIKLIDAMKDENQNIRACAARAFGKIGDSKAMALLLDGFREEMVKIDEVMEAFMKMGKSAKDLLLDALNDKDKYIRACATRAIGKLKDKGTIDNLIKCLKDEDEYVRQGAAYALGEIGDKIAVEALIKSFEDPSQNVRVEVVWALGEIGDSSAIISIINVLKNSHEDMIVRLRASDSLVKLGEQAIDSLSDCMDDEDEFVRECASYALGKIGDHRAVEKLVSKLKDSNMSVASMAAHSLGEIGSAISTESVVEAYVEGCIKEESLTKFFFKIAKKTIYAIAEYTKSNNVVLAKIAVKALGESGNPEAVEILATALEETDGFLLKDVVIALGRIKDKSSAKLLVKIKSQTESQEIKLLIDWALKSIGET